MNRMSAEIAEKVWEDTHAQALLFAQKLALTTYELNLPKPSVMFADNLEVGDRPRSTQPVMFGDRPASSKPGTAKSVSESGDTMQSLSLADFYATDVTDREMMSAPQGAGSRAVSPALSTARPFSRAELRIQTPKATEMNQEPLDLGELSQRSMDSLDSMTSMLTTSSICSFGSGSSSSVIPFPFRNPPHIPHVDTFVREGLRYAEIKQGARLRKAAQRRQRRWQRQELDSIAASPGSPGSGSDGEHNGVSFAAESTGSCDSEPITAEHIESVMSYFQEFSSQKQKLATTGTGKSRSSPVPSRASTSTSTSGGQDKQYEISLADFETALRKHSRALVTAEDEKLARGLLESLKWLLKEKNLSAEAWFRSTDTQRGDAQVHGDNKLTLRELTAGIDFLCDSISMPRWRRQDVSFMLRQIDPNGDGDLSLPELTTALDQLSLPPLTSLLIERAGPVLRRIQVVLKTKGIKVKDVFKAVDKDGSQSISADELRMALHSVLKMPRAAGRGGGRGGGGGGVGVGVGVGGASGAVDAVGSGEESEGEGDSESEGEREGQGRGQGQGQGQGKGQGQGQASTTATSPSHSTSTIPASYSPLLRALKLKALGKGHQPTPIPRKLAPLNPKKGLLVEMQETIDRYDKLVHAQIGLMFPRGLGKLGKLGKRGAIASPVRAVGPTSRRPSVLL